MERTLLMKLLDAHRELLDKGCRKSAETLAIALLDRTLPTTKGGGVIEPLEAPEALLIADRVIHVASDKYRPDVVAIMKGVA